MAETSTCPGREPPYNRGYFIGQRGDRERDADRRKQKQGLALHYHVLDPGDKGCLLGVLHLPFIINPLAKTPFIHLRKTTPISLTFGDCGLTLPSDGSGALNLYFQIWWQVVIESHNAKSSTLLLIYITCVPRYASCQITSSPPLTPKHGYQVLF